MTENEKGFMIEYGKLFDFKYSIEQEINRRRIEILEKYEFTIDDHHRLVKMFHSKIYDSKCVDCGMKITEENTSSSQRNLKSSICKKCVSIRNKNARNK